MKIDTTKANEMGKEAYKTGLRCVPVLDKTFMESIRGREVGDPRTIPETRAWIAGWLEENLKD